jgi:predicted XRE-type DNA-binding protein
MNANNDFREKMLSHPSYWVENINGLMYDAIVTYMKEHKMKRKDLALHLDISPGRVSQILNDGDTNFSIEKLVEIALKVDKIPNLIFEDKAQYFEKEKSSFSVKTFSMPYNGNLLFQNDLSEITKSNQQARIIPIQIKDGVSESFQLLQTY